MARPGDKYLTDAPDAAVPSQQAARPGDKYLNDPAEHVQASTPTAPKMGAGEAFTHGWASGVPFSENLGGVATAAFESSPMRWLRRTTGIATPPTDAFGKEDKPSTAQAYKEGMDAIREKHGQAHRDRPVIAGAGKIGAGIALGVLGAKAVGALAPGMGAGTQAVVASGAEGFAQGGSDTGTVEGAIKGARNYALIGGAGVLTIKGVAKAAQLASKVEGGVVRKAAGLVGDVAVEALPGGRMMQRAYRAALKYARKNAGAAGKFAPEVVDDIPAAVERKATGEGMPSWFSPANEAEQSVPKNMGYQRRDYHGNKPQTPPPGSMDSSPERNAFRAELKAMPDQAPLDEALARRQPKPSTGEDAAGAREADISKYRKEFAQSGNVSIGGPRANPPPKSPSFKAKLEGKAPEEGMRPAPGELSQFRRDLAQEGKGSVEDVAKTMIDKGMGQRVFLDRMQEAYIKAMKAHKGPRVVKGGKATDLEKKLKASLGKR